MNAAVLVEQLLAAVRAHQPTDELTQVLARLDPAHLGAQLTTDAHKVTFWVNLYNATVLLVLRQNPELYQHKARFFGRRCVAVAGTVLSFNDIEHGILRRSQWGYGLGYVRAWWAPAFERQHRVARPDCRIHFALNCGARSCPPIRHYRADQFDAQLDTATYNYLETNVTYEDDVARLPALLGWYLGDFGGRAGIRRLVRRYGPQPAPARPRLRWQPYDWQLHPDNFVD